MNRTILSLLVVGLFVGAGATAYAPANADDSNTQQPAKSAKQADPSTAAVDESAAEAASYKAAKAKANADFKDAKTKCQSEQGEPMRTCMTEAKMSQTEALALAKEQWDNRASAQPVDPSTFPVAPRKTPMK